MQTDDTSFQGRLRAAVTGGRKVWPDGKRSALLLSGQLALVARWRFGLGVAGGVFLGLAVWASTAPGAAALVFLALCAALALLAGEVLERTLFFRALSSSHMPGGLQ